MTATADDTDIGYGTLFKKKVADNTYKTLAEVVEFNPPEYTRDAVNFTHMQSPDRWREYKPGMREPGETSLTYNLIPGEADDDEIAESFASDETETWRVVYPNGATLDVRGFFTSHSHAVPMEDKMTGAATFKLSGKPVLTAAA